jgi:hypothetical protein
MPLVLIPPTEPEVYVDATPSPLDRAQRLSATSQLGFGITRPFRRDNKSDFAADGGKAQVVSRVGQILGMRGANPDNPAIQGELEWDPARGSLINLLRHQKNDFLVQELGRVYVSDALARWEPCVRLKSVRCTRVKDDTGQPRILLVRIFYDILASNQPGNQVLFENVEQTVTITS